MKRKRTLILIAQIVITLLVGVFLFSTTNKQLESEKVFVYDLTIDELNRPLAEEDIKEVSIPKRAITKEMETNKDNIIGKYIDRKVTKGHTVYKDQLVELEDVDVFETMDLTDKRKISLPISYVDGLSGNLKKGDKVDLAYVGAGQAEKGEFRYGKVFMQNLPVWSINTGDGFRYVDKSSETTESYIAEEKIDAQSGEGELAVITLAVTLDQLEEIKARESAGTISFVGRFDDSESYDSMGFVLGDYEKIFSGQGYAETGRVEINKNDFDEVFKEVEKEVEKDEQ